MMVLMFYFLVVAVAVIGASAIIGLLLTNLSSIVSHLPIEQRKKHLVLIALGALSAFPVTKLKLAWLVF